MYDANDLSIAVNELPALPLAISSLSSSADGKYALATALDGTAAVVGVKTGREGARVETARESVDSAGE
jgi:WD repeat-containing protein 61